MFIPQALMTVKILWCITDAIYTAAWACGGGVGCGVGQAECLARLMTVKILWCITDAIYTAAWAYGGWGGVWGVGGGYVSLGQNHPHQNHCGPGQARAQRPYAQAGRLPLPSRLRSELDLNRKFNISKAPNVPSASCASRPQLCVPDSRWC